MPREKTDPNTLPVWTGELPESHRNLINSGSLDVRQVDVLVKEANNQRFPCPRYFFDSLKAAQTVILDTRELLDLIERAYNADLKTAVRDKNTPFDAAAALQKFAEKIAKSTGVSVSDAMDLIRQTAA